MLISLIMEVVERDKERVRKREIIIFSKAVSNTMTPLLLSFRCSCYRVNSLNHYGEFYTN